VISVLGGTITYLDNYLFSQLILSYRWKKKLDYSLTDWINFT